MKNKQLEKLINAFLEGEPCHTEPLSEEDYLFAKAFTLYKKQLKGREKLKNRFQELDKAYPPNIISIFRSENKAGEKDMLSLMKAALNNDPVEDLLASQNQSLTRIVPDEIIAAFLSQDDENHEPE